jgi:ornithine--oxo-acid transaminase
MIGFDFSLYWIRDMSMHAAIAHENRFGAMNYAPLPVVLSRGDGVWLYDIDGKRYLDMMGAYSAVSHGHGHPRIIAAAKAQLDRLGVVSRAFHHDQMIGFLEILCRASGMERCLPMNTGAEAVETAIKAARRYAYRVKGVAKDQAEIIVMEGNFHGRTTTIVGFSSEPAYKDGFGPFAPGFVTVPFGDVDAVVRAITPNTAAIILEPIQGEAGIILPPSGYLRELRALCDANNVLLIVDEIQSGLGRTGKMFCFQHEGIQPDGLIVGKALGGGIIPVSAFLSRADVMDVFRPGSHGSTFGGYPLAAAVAQAALESLIDEQLVENSALNGERLIAGLRNIRHNAIRDVRGLGLWCGVDLDPTVVSARAVCMEMLHSGVLTKETHETVVRFAPPLTVAPEQIDHALSIFEQSLHQAAANHPAPAH